MKSIARNTFLAATLFALGCGEDDSGSAGWAEVPVVTLDDGEVEGDRVGESVRFLKIPYAKPPEGALRWKEPVKNEPWEGRRHEEGFGSPCPQNASSQGGPSVSEDCLYLNVWTPAVKPEKAPVMVWIHGGGNFAGSASDKVPDPLAAANAPLWYDGQTFAEKQGVIVVTFNYRLGPFGFFSHPALRAEGSAPANQGLLDQNAVLTWVRDNIAEFGGDAGNVTIFGESAGSSDVCYHVVSPKSRGLFHRAISQSGGCTVGPQGTRDRSADESAEGMRAFAAAVGCDDEASVLSCLREKSVAEIMMNSMQPDPSRGFFHKSEWTFAAAADGEGGFIPKPAREAFESGDVAKVPYLIGSNNDEGSLFAFMTPVPDEATYLSLLQTAFGDNAERVAEAYPGSRFNGDFAAAYARVLGDSSLVCGTHDVALEASAAGLPVFMYNFNIPWSVGFGALGAAHAAEISHVFGAPYMADAGGEAAAAAMNRYWATFARTGDPNFEGGPARWPAFSGSADKRLQLAAEFTPLTDFRKDECALWRSIYKAEKSAD